jgi:hypothetical protein
MTEPEDHSHDDQTPTRTRVRGRTTSRIVLPKAARQKQQSRRLWALIASIALVTSLVLLATLVLGPRLQGQ